MKKKIGVCCVALALMVCGCSLTEKSTQATGKVETTTAANTTTKATTNVTTSTTAKTTTAVTEKQTEEDESLPLGTRNALKSAKSYLSHSSFSHDGLIGQLEYEGYTKEEATYAADNCGADWMEQAVKCAQSYIDHSSFSKKELLEQLKYEGFTDEQAKHGVEAVGY